MRLEGDRHLNHKNWQRYLTKCTSAQFIISDGRSKMLCIKLIRLSKAIEGKQKKKIRNVQNTQQVPMKCGRPRKSNTIISRDVKCECMNEDRCVHYCYDLHNGPQCI
jgi:hypothetical protein